MSFEDDIRGDLDVFLSDAEFAIQALVNGNFVNGVFDPGMEGDREPRSPHFLCKDSDLATVEHGDPVLIDWTDYAVTQTGVITYWIEGYQPDGTGMATLILKEQKDVIPMFILSIDSLNHGHSLDQCNVFVSQFPINIEDMRHGHELEAPELEIIPVKIDATRDQITKIGDEIQSIVAVDGRTYTVQTPGGVRHGIATSPGGQLVYAFDGSLGAFLQAAGTPVIQQPFTVFIVARRGASGNHIMFDNQ